MKNFIWPINKFSDHYFDIINQAKDKKLQGFNGYCENHHIIPQCFGGNNDKNNIVLLPAKYHYYAHYWLMLMFENTTEEHKSMTFGFRKMHSSPSKNKENRREINGELFAQVREKCSNLQKGRKMSEYNKLKLLEAHLGSKHSEETKKKISESRKGWKDSPETIKKKIAWRIGSTDSSETKEKRAAHHRGKKRSEQAKRNMREGRRLAKLKRSGIDTNSSEASNI